MNDPSKVGYRKPPKEHQFKKGRSGNPRGRPRKQKPANPSEAEILRKISAETVVVDGKEMTKLELWLRVLEKKALQGDLRAMKLLEEKLQKAGIDGGKPQRQGVLVLPPPVSEEDWIKQAEQNQAKYRERKPDD
ncbi:DUF5681 domain-containing protein [Sphingorhabdus sp. Alg231-15]|uniref:DUF5681 domain-containing protein n=1 Tax=Sphingorhabdus sp. Alg231-15 TaxID=1922222 RepID=UPI000D561441